MSEHPHTCLNCSRPVTDKYCGNCGQKAATHRFDLRHFLEHDIIHGVFHLDKGFPYTAKQLLTRPGHAIREYIDGKRVSYFNPVTFLLLLLAVNVFIMSNIGLENMVSVDGKSGTGSTLAQINHFYTKYIKQLYLITIPFYSLFTYLLFRKTKHNYAEHLVMNTYRESGLIIINTVSLLVSALAHNIWGKSSLIIAMVSSVLSWLYTFFFYKQYFGKDYNDKTAFVFLVIVAIILPAILFGALSIGLIYLLVENNILHLPQEI